MNMKCRPYFLLTAMLLYASVLYAQSDHRKRSILSVHTGLARYTGKLTGVAGHSSDLRNGIGWAGSYTYLVGNDPSVKVGFGMLYQGARYTGDTPHSTDRIQTHYVAPQFSMHWLKQSFGLYVTAGTGYQFYKDHSTVYDKPRKVSMNKWAANFGMGGEYRPFAHWGISARINYILAYSGEYSVRYHDREWLVWPHYPLKGSNDISQLSFSAGINYHF